MSSWILLLTLAALSVLVHISNTTNQIQETAASIAVKTAKGIEKDEHATSEDEGNIKQDDVDGFGNDGTRNDPDVRSELPGLLAKYCPAADVCQEDRSWKLSEKVSSSSCCRACSCSDNCQVSKSCCFPSPDVDNTENEHSSCYSTIHPAGDDSEKLGYKSYMMVDSEMSQSTMTDMTTNSTCGDTQVAPWGSLHPVYSKSHQKIYKNSVCAAAYGVNDGIPWKVYLACIHVTALSLSIISHSNSFFTKRCNVWFEFPGNISDLEEHLCYLNLISACPETSSVTASMSLEQLTAACESGLFSTYRGRDRAIYRNVFCSVCNGQYPNVDCLSDEQAPRFKRGFTALLDGSIFEAFNDQSLYTRVQQACMYKEGIMIENTCRPVSCPSDQMYTTDGKCEFIFTTWYKPEIAVFLQLMSDVAINTTGLTELSLMSPWLRHWKLSKIKCITSSQDYHPEITTKLFVVLRNSYESMKPSVLVSIIDELKNKEWTLKTENTSSILRSEFAVGYDSYLLSATSVSISLEINDTRRLHTIYTDGTSAFVGLINIGRKSFCDQIGLTAEEFRISNNVLYNNFTGEYLLPDDYYFPQLRDETLVRVCIEDSGLTRVRNGCQALVITIYISFLYVFILVCIY